MHTRLLESPMNNHDCPECAAFAAELKAAMAEWRAKHQPLSPEDAQRRLARYLSLSEEQLARLRESLGASKAGQIYARFIGASHPHRLQ